MSETKQTILALRDASAMTVSAVFLWRGLIYQTSPVNEGDVYEMTPRISFSIIIEKAASYRPLSYWELPDFVRANFIKKDADIESELSASALEKITRQMIDTWLAYA